MVFMTNTNNTQLKTNSNCPKCNKLRLEPNITYGINPNAVCNCDSNNTLDELRKKIEQTCENACNNPATGMYADLDNKELNYPKLVQELIDLFTHQLQLAKIEAKIDENKDWLSNNGPAMDENVVANCDFIYRIRELNKQKEELQL